MKWVCIQISTTEREIYGFVLLFAFNFWFSCCGCVVGCRVGFSLRGFVVVLGIVFYNVVVLCLIVADDDDLIVVVVVLGDEDEDDDG
ncbi:hypothetical protein P8452_16640 [Trifolium repens]|nr:hypothetical protein P8452_16640 [Trifolium repens]